MDIPEAKLIASVLAYEKARQQLLDSRKDYQLWYKANKGYQILQYPKEVQHCSLLQLHYGGYTEDF